jgi:hypothetical protein
MELDPLLRRSRWSMSPNQTSCAVGMTGSITAKGQARHSPPPCRSIYLRCVAFCSVATVAPAFATISGARAHSFPGWYAFHQRLIEAGEIPKNTLVRRCIRDRVGGIDHRLPARFASPAAFSASSATLPLTARYRRWKAVTPRTASQRQR